MVLKALKFWPFQQNLSTFYSYNINLLSSPENRMKLSTQVLEFVFGIVLLWCFGLTSSVALEESSPENEDRGDGEIVIPSIVRQNLNVKVIFT